MKRGDFSRLTFDRDKNLLRVLKQQGRVELDAEWNEQVAILLDYVRTVAADLIGPHGAPEGEDGGFAVELVASQRDRYSLTPGRYYVNGLLCRNAATRLSAPPDPLLPGGLARGRAHLLFLDAWERDITWIQDAGIRESALGGLDTSLRSQVVWRVRSTDKRPNGTDIPGETPPLDVKDWSAWVEQWQSQNRGKLAARARPSASKETNPCVASPEALYRGLENQLYRVEIHRGGEAGEATFKWSRDNGSVTFAVHRLAGEVAWLERPAGLQPGHWVELLDDEREQADEPGILLQIESVDSRQASVKLKVPRNVALDLPEYDEDEVSARHPYLRRWDHQEGSLTQGVPRLVEGALAVTEGTDEAAWLNLEDGVQIRFQPGAVYRAGDYWLIPARTATGDVEWPGEEGQPEARPPHGPEHHYAPLAHLALDPAGTVTIIKKFRRTIKPAA
jgi:hypothetical protein